jgi:chromate transporter
MEAETVRQRSWLTAEEFLDLLGATHLIPGPNSTELAMHLGYRRAGYWGLWLAGTAFILPAALLVTGLAALYERWGNLPSTGRFLYGIQAVMIAVVVQAALGLGKSALNRPWLIIVAGVVWSLRRAGVHELALLLAAGCFGVVRQRHWITPGTSFFALPILGLTAPWSALMAWLGGLPIVVRLFLIFLKIGAVLYGSGYVLLAFLQSDLVDRLHWVTAGQLMDAVAVGQATPGPVLTTATFLGYLVGGPAGAAAGTIGIFLPAFVFVAMTCRWLPQLRKSGRWGPFVDGVNAASLGLLADVATQLGRAAIVDAGSAALAMVSLGLLLGTRVNSVWLMLGGAAVGWWIHG